jgi:hypothetical protein
MTDIPDEAVEAAWKAFWGPRSATVMDGRGARQIRRVLEAAQPFMQCSCPHISEVDDHCPQHGRDA